MFSGRSWFDIMKVWTTFGMSNCGTFFLLMCRVSGGRASIGLSLFGRSRPKSFSSWTTTRRFSYR